MMPYTMAIFPNEKISVPEIGDYFVVTEVVYPVTDIHEGECTHIELSQDESIITENKRLCEACIRLAHARRTKWATSDSSNEPYIVFLDDVELAKAVLKNISDSTR